MSCPAQRYHQELAVANTLGVRYQDGWIHALSGNFNVSLLVLTCFCSGAD